MKSRRITMSRLGIIEPLRSPGARQEAASVARGGAGGAGSADRSRPLALAPPPVRQMRRSLSQLEASLAESRANEARMQRSHAALARKLHALAAALDQATRCNRALVVLAVVRAQGGVAAAAGREALQEAGLRRALDALQRRLSARHRVIESLCTRFLHMKRRRDLQNRGAEVLPGQAVREEEVAGAVRSLQALLGHATAVLRRAALQLCEERLGNRTCRCCGRPQPRRAHAATQTFFGSALANGTWVRRSTTSSPELALKGTARQLNSSTESLPDL
ncbi:Protein of unknown function, partial [Gryllus bimaculatus]